jgi:hypothetical protein
MGTSMKKYIVKALKWALNKFEDRTAEIAAWPFPVGQEPKIKRKPALKKATTRTPATKKPVLKKTVKKAK